MQAAAKRLLVFVERISTVAQHEIEFQRHVDQPAHDVIEKSADTLKTDAKMPPSPFRLARYMGNKTQ